MYRGVAEGGEIVEREKPGEGFVGASRTLACFLRRWAALVSKKVAASSKKTQKPEVLTRVKKRSEEFALPSQGASECRWNKLRFSSSCGQHAGSSVVRRSRSSAS